MSGTSPGFVFGSADGAQLCRQIVKQKLQFDPHDYVVEGVCKALDGEDLLAITPTGSGKTSFLICYLVVMNAVLENPSLCPPATFPRNPAMIVVVPTKSLEMDMEPKFAKARLSAIIINKDTVHQSKCVSPPLDLWESAAQLTIQVLLLSPEQLRTDGYASLMRNDKFKARVVALAVDEVHLMDAWGDPSFRPAFRQIGYARARLSSSAILFGLTATLRAGKPTEAVRKFLGFREGKTHVIRRSNIRYDIHLEFRTVISGARAMAFPELDWVLSDSRSIVVFCRTISLGFRVALYLWHRADALPDRGDRIRLYNSLNAASYNCRTLALMHTDTRSRVTIATDTLAVGIDAPNTQIVVLYDHELPENTDVILQKIGRIRDGVGRDTHGIVYLPKNAEERAQLVLKNAYGEPKSTSRLSKRAGASREVVDTSTARLVLAKCKIGELDAIYDNPRDEAPCTCEGCTENPRPARPQQCTCSGCTGQSNPQPVSAPRSNPVAAPATPSSPQEISTTQDGDTTHGRSDEDQPRGATACTSARPKKITKKMREHAKSELAKFRLRLWWNDDARAVEMRPSEDYLPELLMDVLLDDFHHLTDVAALAKTLMDYEPLRKHHAALFKVIEDLRAQFIAMDTETRAAAREKRRATLARKKQLALSGSGAAVSELHNGSLNAGLGSREGEESGNESDEYWDSDSEGDPESMTEGDTGRDAPQRTSPSNPPLILRIPPSQPSVVTEDGKPSAGKIRIPGGRMMIAKKTVLDE